VNPGTNLVQAGARSQELLWRCFAGALLFTS